MKACKKKVAAVNINAYEDLMEKYARTKKELDAIKKGSQQVNAITDDSESRVDKNVNYMQQGNNRQGGYGARIPTIVNILNNHPRRRTLWRR